jgi:hypothetical protein
MLFRSVFNSSPDEKNDDNNNIMPTFVKRKIIEFSPALPVLGGARTCHMLCLKFVRTDHSGLIEDF